jgi:transposase
MVKANNKKRKQQRASSSNELASLREMTRAMAARGNAEQALEVLFGVVEKLQQDNERLVYRLAASTRARFGRRSEKLSAEQLGQLVLAMGGSEEQAAATDPTLPVSAAPTEAGEQGPSKPETKRPKKRRVNHKGRTALHPDLPRDITVVPVPEGERHCIHCGVEMQCAGHIDHETVDLVPASIRVRVERREKLACKSKACQQDITAAPRKETRAYTRRAGMSLLAHLVEAKCDDALPIYRQQDQLRRLGFDAPLNTLYGYWDHATALLVPVADAIVSTLLADPIVGIDDTKLDYLDPADPRGKQRGHLWCFVGIGPLVGFVFTESWRAEEIEPWISAIDGHIQCDDYKGYGSTVVGADGVGRVLVPPERRLGCMMHVRRRFHRAYLGGHLQAAVPLKLIADIYDVEAEAKTKQLDLRREKSAPVLEQLDTWVDDNLPQLRPKSPGATAACYAKEQRSFVRRCFEDGRFEIDNGRVEREIREPAIGRKNYLFTGSVAGATRLAAAYTVVLSARHRQLPVRSYLIDILGKLDSGWPARRLTELLPHRWAQLHAPGAVEKKAEQASQNRPAAVS